MLCQDIPEVIMKTILNMCFILLFGLSTALAQTDTTKIKNKEENREQIKEETNLKNQSEEDGLQNRIMNELNPNEKGKGKRKKDIFIDKDGDGISDTRVGGMSLNKLRKRVRSGRQGTGQSGSQGNGQGNGGNGGNGSGGPGGN